MFKIGVMVDSFRCGVKEGIEKAAKLGAAGIQVYAVAGEMDPDNLTAADRRRLLQFIKDRGLVVAAVCGDLGGHGFAVAEDNPVKIEKSKKIVDLARDLEATVVTTHIGVVPEENNDVRKVMREACNELGSYAESMGATFAIETGPETCQRLKEFLDELDTTAVRVNYDPANLVMVTGDDPVEGVRILGDYIVHTHAKDGIMKQQTDPKVIYDYFAEGGIEDLRLSDYFLETPLGQGNVDFPAYLAALKEVGYDGFLTIEREVGEEPEKDIAEAVKFLQRLLAEV